jgi:hypothetical protein
MFTNLVLVVAYTSAASVLIPLGPWLTRLGLPGFLGWPIASFAAAVFGLLMAVALISGLQGLWEDGPEESFLVLEVLIPYIFIAVMAGWLLPAFARVRALRGLPPLEPPGWMAYVPVAFVVLMLALHAWGRIVRSRRR